MSPVKGRTLQNVESSLYEYANLPRRYQNSKIFVWTKLNAVSPKMVILLFLYTLKTIHTSLVNCISKWKSYINSEPVSI